MEPQRNLVDPIALHKDISSVLYNTKGYKGNQRWVNPKQINTYKW